VTSARQAPRALIKEQLSIDGKRQGKAEGNAKLTILTGHMETMIDDKGGIWNKRRPWQAIACGFGLALPEAIKKALGDSMA